VAYDYEDENRRALQRSIEDDASHARAIRAAWKAGVTSLGGAGGGVLGGWIGTLILPGVGTAIGAVIGTALGAGTGAYTGSRIVDHMTRESSYQRDE